VQWFSSTIIKTAKLEESLAKKGIREKIVEAASRRFHEFGYNATGIQDIVDAAHIPKGSFYAHFKSKEALGLEVLQEDAQVTEATLDLTPGIPPLDRLRAHFNVLASDYYRLKYRSGCLIGDFASELSSNPKFRQATLHHHTEWSANLATVIKQAQETGDVDSSQDSGLLARYLLDSFLGSALRTRMARSQDPYHEFLKVGFDILLSPAPKSSAKKSIPERKAAKKSKTL
jgi:TetR/AcrR family transcriptional repressor of nem operon